MSTRRQNQYLLVLLILIVAGAVVGAIVEANFGSEIGSGVVQVTMGSFQPTTTTVRERMWKLVERKTEQIPSKGQPPFFRASTLRVDALGYVYVLDWGDFLIKKYSPRGEFVQSFGKGEGRGPGRFLNPMDYTVAEDGSVWVCDPRALTLTVFAPDGSLRRTIPCPMVPMRAVVLDSGLFVLSVYQGEDLFELHDSTGQTIRSFGRFISEQAKFKIAIDGWIVKTNRDRFVYNPAYAGLLSSFSTAGRSLFYTESVDKMGWPKLAIRNGGVFIDQHNITGVTFSLSCDGENVFLFTGPTTVKEKTGVIDAYNSSDGTYRFSLRLPEEFDEAVVTRGNIYTLRDTTISVWQR